jgi:Peptidase family M28/PDZ domain/PA domain
MNLSRRTVVVGRGSGLRALGAARSASGDRGWALGARRGTAGALAIAACLAAVSTLNGDTSKTRASVEALASDRFAGRLAGSQGERAAADYIVGQLQKIGAKPLPGKTDLRLPFDFTAGTKDGGSRLTYRSSSFTGTDTVQALSFSDNGEVTAPVVFAGYGIVVPDSQSFGYDSYAGVDVKDKVVIVFRYFPEDADQKTKGILARYSDLRYKAMAARQHGAKALLVVTGPRSPNAGETVRMSFDTALAGSGILAASISGDVAKTLFASLSDKNGIDAIQKSLDSGNPHVPGFALPEVTVTLHTAVVREKQTANNIVAVLPATPASATASDGAKPYVMLGAHYDHLGRGDHGNTLARKDEAGQIHHGADDNASGTAAVLAIGSELARQPRHRSVVLAFWSGEELGLIGSAAFAAAPPLPLDRIEAYINFDMVGRMQDNKLTIQAMGTSPAWPKLIEQTNVAAGFDLQLQDDPYQPTDVATFNQSGVPSLTFFTGTHADYHRPTDTADKIDFEDLDRVVDFAVALTGKLEQLDAPPQFAKVEQKADQGGGRAGVRVFTGTIPDYSSDAKGLLLSGVIGGGPAEQAGLQKGDVIVEITGQTITNIYDYTYALELLKIGQPAKVVYMRAGQRRETTITPAARK